MNNKLHLNINSNLLKKKNCYREESLSWVKFTCISTIVFLSVGSLIF